MPINYHESLGGVKDRRGRKEGNAHIPFRRGCDKKEAL